MKSIREWLETLPEPYKGQALANMEKQRPGDKGGNPSSIERAIEGAFRWEGTEEGHTYWSDLRDKYKSMTLAVEAITPTLPTNALSALHAIAAKEGFAVEEIMSVRPEREDESNGCGWYYTVRHTMIETFINLSNE